MKINKILSVLLLAGCLITSTVSVTATDMTEQSSLDLTAYTDEQLPVYQNSRVTAIKRNGTNLIVEGYAFVKDVNFSRTDALWREIIFVNKENTSPENAYRYQVTSTKKGQFLTNNKTLNPTGKYNYQYATYSVTVNLASTKKYDNKTYETMKPGDYYVFIRVSDGKHGKLFPLQNIRLSDGSIMDLPQGFSYAKEGTQDLLLTISNTEYETNKSNSSSENGSGGFGGSSSSSSNWDPFTKFGTTNLQEYQYVVNWAKNTIKQGYLTTYDGYDFYFIGEYSDNLISGIITATELYFIEGNNNPTGNAHNAIITRTGQCGELTHLRQALLYYAGYTEAIAFHGDFAALGLPGHVWISLPNIRPDLDEVEKITYPRNQKSYLHVPYSDEYAY